MKIQILASPPDQLGNRKAVGIKILSIPESGSTMLLPADAVERHKDFVELNDEGFLYHTVDGDVLLRIVREPGRYCLTCGERLPDHGGNGTMTEARRAKQCLDHVDSHGGKAEQSDDWPHGYISRPRTFECVVEDMRS